MPNPAERFDLEALELQAVRDLLKRHLVSPLGRTCVDEMVPLVDAAPLARTLAQVREMAAALERGDRVPVTGFVDVRPWLDLVPQNRHTPDGADFAALKKLLFASTRVRNWLRALAAAEHPELVRLGGRLPDLETLAQELERMVDDAGEVLSSASTRLLQIRGDLKLAEDALQVACDRLLEDRRLRGYLQSGEVTFRHGRPVVQVKLEYRPFVPGILHDRSQSGQTLFIEPQALVERANAVADLKAAEHREVQVILTEATRRLLVRLPDVQTAISVLGWFDFTHARARLVQLLGWHVPEISPDGVLRLRGARHPLLLLARERAEDVVPLDLDLGGAHHMIVVTGPNTGGKTVALKTAGVLVAMAQCGLPVPAAPGTQVPVLDGVFVDIGDEQEIAQNLSTFSSHMRRIVRCLTQSTERSLLLIDELGAGTDPEEGGALGYAILEEIHRRGHYTVVTTHLGRLKEFAYSHAGAVNGAMAFDPVSLRPLYRLQVGLPGASNALHIARQVGVPGTVVDRAGQLLAQRDRSMEAIIDSIQMTRIAAEDEKRRSEQVAREVGEGARALEREKEAMEQRRAWLHEEADKLVDDELRTARRLLETPLKEFVNAPAPYGRKATELLEALVLLLRGSSVGRRRQLYVESLKKGDVVYVPRYRRKCAVQKVDRARERVEVIMGGMKTDLPYEEISWLMPLDEGTT